MYLKEAADLVSARYATYLAKRKIIAQQNTKRLKELQPSIETTIENLFKPLTTVLAHGTNDVQELLTKPYITVKTISDATFICECRASIAIDDLDKLDPKLKEYVLLKMQNNEVKEESTSQIAVSSRSAFSLQVDMLSRCMERTHDMFRTICPMLHQMYCDSDKQLAFYISVKDKKEIIFVVEFTPKPTCKDTN